MADAGRKPVTDQIKETVTPQSQKSTGEKAKEGITGGADKAAGAAKPDSEKSMLEKGTDSVKNTTGLGK